MRDFYTRVAGLRETRAATIEGAHIDALTGLRGVKLEAVFLGTEDRPEAIELLKYHHHPDPNPARGPSGNGPNHVQFVVDELDPIVDALRTEGLDVWGGPVDWPRIWHRKYQRLGNVWGGSRCRPLLTAKTSGGRYAPRATWWNSTSGCPTRGTPGTPRPIGGAGLGRSRP